MSEERLQKVMAAAGIGSRRACEELIDRRRVTVNGKVARLGDKVNAESDVIHVDGQRVVTDTRLVYLAINKPRGVVSTMADEHGREAIADYVGDIGARVYHVGRLDADSEGLMLLTNDGSLAHKLTHPSFEVPKTYLAEVPGPLPRAVGRALQSGVELEDGRAKVDSFRLVQAIEKTALVEVVLHEGRNRIVRRMFDELGFPVQRLIRTSIGPIKLGDLKAGRHRRLNPGEIAALFKLVERSGQR
jgi:23S rRNA pseudouridine2605 synthase